MAAASGWRFQIDKISHFQDWIKRRYELCIGVSELNIWKRQISESNYHPTIKGKFDCQDRFVLVLDS